MRKTLNSQDQVLSSSFPILLLLFGFFFCCSFDQSLSSVFGVLVKFVFILFLFFRPVHRNLKSDFMYGDVVLKGSKQASDAMSV